MADNRVVIKINYDKNKQRKALIDPKMVTVWHKQRILVAIAILVFLVVLIVSWFFTKDAGENIQPSSEKVNSAVAIPGQTAEVIKPAVNISAVSEADLSKQSKTVKRPAAIILDKRVIRASLSTAPRYGEPGEPITPPVTLEPNQTIELFYFSEIKNLKDKVLFHRWFKAGQLVYKKEFLVKTNKSKLISSKEFSAKDAGEWQAVLIDNNGKIFSQANFSVNP